MNITLYFDMYQIDKHDVRLNDEIIDKIKSISKALDNNCDNKQPYDMKALSIITDKMERKLSEYRIEAFDEALNDVYKEYVTKDE